MTKNIYNKIHFNKNLNQVSKNSIKNLMLIILILGMSSINGNAQYTFDGNYSPCSPPQANDEYANASAPNPQPAAGSSTCDVNAVYGDTYSDNGTNYMLLAVQHGNSGQSTFRIFLNSDCKETTGALTAFLKGTSGDTAPVGGAEYYVEFETGNNASTNTFEWNGSSWVASTSGAIILGDSCSSSGNFFEFRIPIEELFDPCLDNECNAIEITQILSNAGGNDNSQACDNEKISVSVPVNNPPNPNFTIKQTCDINSPVEGGFIPSIELTATSLDPDLINGDIISYAWSYYLNNNTGTSFTSGFSNQSGTSITNATTSIVNTTFTPSVADLPGTYTFVLTVVDSFGCNKLTENGQIITATYTIDIAVLDNAGCALLPINLGSFITNAVGLDTKIDWVTLSESNNDYFEIQRSTNGLAFETIHQLDGQGDSQNQVNYTYTDKSAALFSDVLYYRIKQVDFDGQFSYTPVRLVSFEDINIPSQLFPTLAKSGQIITIQSEMINTVSVYTLWGELVDVIDGQGQRATSIDTSMLSAGLYIVTIDDKETLKFIIH